MLLRVKCTVDQKIFYVGLLDMMPITSLIAVASWYLWWERRQCAKGEKTSTPEQSALSIQALSQNNCRASPVDHPAKEVRWTKTLSYTIKVNVDASFEYEDSTTVVGVVLGDDAIDFFAAENSFMGTTAYAYTTEPLAVKKWLELANSSGIHKLLVHSDYAELPKEIQQGAINSVAAPILNNCFDICNNMGHVIFDNCARETKSSGS